MGLLSRVREEMKERAVGAARKVADRAREAIERRMGLPDNRRDESGLDEGPTFSAAGDRGLEGWERARTLFQQVAASSHGVLQARFTDSELALREALDRLEAAAKAKGGPARPWAEAADQLARGWQTQNSRILEAWKASFDRLDLAWLAAGREVGARPWRRAWAEASSRFDAAWLEEWDKFQQSLEDICTELKGCFKEAPLTPGLEPVVPAGLWQKAGAQVDGGIRRVHGDLWGAWGTEGGLIRNCARRVGEGEGTASDIYPPEFSRIEKDFDKALRANVQDMRDSWIVAVDLLIQGLEATA